MYFLSIINTSFVSDKKKKKKKKLDEIDGDLIINFLFDLYFPYSSFNTAK